MIRIILPVCARDFPLVNLLGHRFIKFGDLKEKSLLVVACWKDKFEIPGFVEKLSPHLKLANYHIIPDVPEDMGWPTAANWMFYETAKYLDKVENADPWWWFEPDCCPLVPGWLDRCNEAYEIGGKPYWGVVNTTRFRNRETGERIERGTHMVGSGVYPADFFKTCKAVHFLSETIPFDLEIQDEVVPQCQPTMNIFHAHNTCRYKVVNGEVIGEDIERPDRIASYGGRPIWAEAVVVHGCKDDSLYKIDFERLRANL
jgi:hypothetical protein